VDGNNPEVIALVSTIAPKARILGSPTLIGPGGARNRLNTEAKSPWIAHFDDDSFPVDSSYFATASELIGLSQRVAVWCATIVSHEPKPEPGSLWQVAVFPGCGHIMNRAWFLRTQGYLPRTVAYNLEEVDVAIQLLALGGLCVQAADLTVWHDHATPDREPPEREVAIMINTILFPLLRYPLSLFPQAAFSILRRALCIAKLPIGLSVLARTAALLPATFSLYRQKRKPVSTSTALSWLLLRKQPLRVQIQTRNTIPL
jgi:hypothetical protein